MGHRREKHLNGVASNEWMRDIQANAAQERYRMEYLINVGRGAEVGFCGTGDRRPRNPDGSLVPSDGSSEMVFFVLLLIGGSIWGCYEGVTWVIHYLHHLYALYYYYGV